MPIGKDKTRIAVTLVKDTAKSVEELAEHEKRTVSAMMAILVEEALNIRNKNKYGFVRGAEYYKNVKGLNHTESEGNK